MTRRQPARNRRRIWRRHCAAWDVALRKRAARRTAPWRSREPLSKIVCAPHWRSGRAVRRLDSVASRKRARFASAAGDTSRARGIGAEGRDLPPPYAPRYNADMRATGSILILLGAVLTVTADAAMIIPIPAGAMPLPADSLEEATPRVTVQRGVAWFYGHRFEAPFTLEYAEGGLAINGYTLPGETRPLPEHRPRHGDTLISELSARMLEILRDARRNHLSGETAFARVEQAYRSSPIVKRVTLQGYSLLLRYKDRPGSYTVALVDPEKVAPGDMTPEEFAERQRGILRKWLLQLRDHFESVGVVVWFEPPAYTLIPNDHSSRVDVLFQRLQRKTKITNEERAFLQATIPTNFKNLRRLTQRPPRLVAVLPHPEQ
jgi:hypothetical protein